MKISIFAATLALLVASFSAMAGDFSQSTPAVWGYDVVSYHVNKRPVRGSGHFTVEHDGATYLFASKQNKDTFSANPEKYVPAYNGYCAFGVALGKKFVGDPEVWRIVDDVLYLNLDANIQDRWLADVSGMIKDGNNNWEKIENVSPAKL
jgi:YHS domain-containing protein